MEFIKLNLGWDAEPNAPMPYIEKDSESLSIKLIFFLNAFIHQDIIEGDKAILQFKNCLKFRLGETNDEGFYRGDCRFYKYGVTWGDFYKINESNWKTYFPNDEVIVRSTIIDNLNLNHYLFYFRDETFECIAESYKFEVIRT